MAAVCAKCSTPLDDRGRCVTCEADAEGLKLLTRSGYASVREMLVLLQAEGLSPEMEKVPPARPEERAHPLWNLYVPEEEVARALELRQRDFSALLAGEEAAAAAARGAAAVDLDAGGDVTCPACGHAFRPSTPDAECPECGLTLGIPADAAPDEAQSS